MTDRAPHAALYALHMPDGDARARPFDPYGEWPKGGWCWVHLKRTDPDAEAWLAGVPWLGEHTIDALLAETTRPRVTAFDDGFVAIIRTIATASQHKDNLISLRAYVASDRMVSVLVDHVPAISAFADKMIGPDAFDSPAEGLVALSESLLEPVGDVVADLGDTLDEIETHAGEDAARSRRDAVLDLRRALVPLRRYLAPQRDALSQLAMFRAPFLTEHDRLSLREIADRLTQIVEELDSVRERAQLLTEELANDVEEQMNATLYVLSVAGAIFLPLTFITGLFGMNVGGIPFLQDGDGFWFLLLLIAGLVAAEIAFLRYLRWI